MTNEELVKEIKKGNHKLMQEIIVKNMDLIYSISNQISRLYQLRYEEKEELKQIGMCALMEAATTFNASKGTQFSTYATIKVRGDMIDYIKKERSIIYIPKQKRKKCSQYRAVENESKNNGEELTDSFLANKMKIKESELVEVRDVLKCYNTESIEGLESSLDNFQLVDKEDKYQEIFLKCDSERMKNLIMKLPNEKERYVLLQEFYYGLLQVEIAKKLGVTKQRVQALRQNGLRNLKKMADIKEMAKEYGIRFK